MTWVFRQVFVGRQLSDPRGEPATLAFRFAGPRAFALLPWNLSGAAGECRLPAGGASAFGHLTRLVDAPTSEGPEPC